MDRRLAAVQDMVDKGEDANAAEIFTPAATRSISCRGTGKDQSPFPPAHVETPFEPLRMQQYINAIQARMSVSRLVISYHGL